MVGSSTSDAPPGGGGGPGASGSDGGTAGSNAPPNGGTITVTLVDRPITAATFSFVAAVQDGSGPWQAAPAPNGDVYTFQVQSSTWGFAYTCVFNTGTLGGSINEQSVREYHFTVAERSSLVVEVPDTCTDRHPFVAVSGTVTNQAGTGGAFVQYGATQVSVGTVAYILGAPANVTHDLILWQTVNPGGSSYVTSTAIIQRAVTFTANTTVDFDASQAVAVSSFPVTASGAVTVDTILNTSNGSTPRLVHSTSTLETQALAQSAAGDVYDQQIEVDDGAATAITTNATATPAAQTFVAPAPLGTATTSLATATPYPILTTTWSSYPAAIGYQWSTTQTLGAGCVAGAFSCVTTWTANLSPGAVGASPSYTMPDLSQLAGWSTNLELAATAAATGYVEAITSSAGAADFPIGPPAAGTQRAFARTTFSITP